MEKNIISRLSLVLILISLVLLSTGCREKEETIDVVESKEDKSPDSYYPITIETYGYDKKPRKIEIKKEPKRVIAIYQNSIETLLALGLEDKIIAASGLDHQVKDEYVYQFESLNYYKNIPSKEEVLSLNPDFILSWYSLFDEKMLGEVDFWHERGINTYMAQNSGVKKPDSLENEYEDIINIGKIFNVEARARKLVDDMKSSIDQAKNLIGDEKVRAIILEVNRDNTYRVYGEDSIGGNIASQVGADLVIKENSQIGIEDLVSLNPQVIFTVYYGDNIARDEALEEIINNEVLLNIDAVKNNRVNPIMLSEVYASGIRTRDGINTIINGLYEEKE